MPLETQADGGIIEKLCIILETGLDSQELQNGSRHSSAQPKTETVPRASDHVSPRSAEALA
jgi:hypothetical protein